MALSESTVTDALKSVLDCNTGRDFGSTKLVKNQKVEGGDVAFDIELGYPAKSQIPALRKALIAAVRTLPGVANVRVNVNLSTKVTAHAVQRGVQLMPKVKNTSPWSPERAARARAPTASRLGRSAYSGAADCLRMD